VANSSINASNWGYAFDAYGLTSCAKAASTTRFAFDIPLT